MRIAEAQPVIHEPSCTEDFSEVVGLQMPGIYRFLLASLRDEDLAQTLTQECFLRAYRSRSNFRRESSVKTWLMRIAINLQIDYWRNRRMRLWREMRANSLDVETASESLPSSERSPEDQFLIREQVAKVWRLVDTLSRRERSVFLLRYVDELQLKEIGGRTGLKVGAVKVYLARALSKLRTALLESDEHQIQDHVPSDRIRYSSNSRSVGRCVLADSPQPEK